MAEALNTRLVGHLDCAGGGQVWVDGRTLYIGHMRHPDGTSVVDVSDPRAPRVLAQIEIPKGWHSHKVRAANGLMIVNHERQGKDSPEFGGGLGIYDVTNPAAPKLITKWKTPGGGVHRFSFDGRYAYISPTVEGYAGNIVMILDLDDPAHLREVGRWWRLANGPPAASTIRAPTASSYAAIIRYGSAIDSTSVTGFMAFSSSISRTLTRPRLLAHVDTTPSFPHPTHTCLPMPQPLKGRRVMVVTDEDVAKARPSPPSFAWVYDVTTETLPIPISTFRAPGQDIDSPQPEMSGCHQPSERVGHKYCAYPGCLSNLGKSSRTGAHGAALFTYTCTIGLKIDGSSRLAALSATIHSVAEISETIGEPQLGQNPRFTRPPLSPVDS